MKFKRLLSILLVTGVFISNTGLNSLADTLSEDGRYETFEGDYLTIGNIIESNKVDVEIEGNTLVNILNYNNLNINNYWTYQDGVGYMKLTDKTDTFKSIQYPTNKEIELNKEYTLFVNITKNSMQRYNNESGAIGKICLAADSGDDNTALIYPSQTGVIKYVFKPKNIINNKPYITIFPDSYNGEFEYKDFMIIEGNHIDKDVEYFEGIKSIGEIEGDNYKLEVKSQNKNIFNGHLENGTYHYNTGEKIPLDSEIRSSEATPVEPGAIYTVSTNASTHNIGIYQYDKDFNFLNSDFPLGKAVTFTADKNCYFINIRICSNDLSSKIQIEKGSLKTEYTKPEKDSYKLQLKEPLRGLPDGTKDRIIKRNGQWVIERNIEEIVLNGSEHWYIDVDRSNSETNYFRTHDFVRENESFDIEYNRKTDFYLNDKYIQNTAQNNWYLIDSEKPNLDVNKGKVVSIREGKLTLDEFKNKLKSNPVAVVCQLVKPYYEPLNIDSSINLYEGTTHISNSSTIPASMKVTIDRVANRAKEFSEAAKLNPTSENISRARMWVNLMDESALKDQFQEDISNIANISDITLERKSVSSNLDIYIKSKNMLSMSLNTNSITFDGYSGTEDMEMLSAVNIAINSSLPYSLNAYMPSEITNTDKSETMPIDTLNIREESEGVYQTFADTSNKIVLKDGCAKGNDKVHTIDLKLASNQAHKADVYKTVIKFEAEQK